MEKISVVVLNYNGIRTVVDTIQSLYNMKGVEVAVILVDDGSTDGSPEAVKQKFPAVQQIVMPANTRNVSYLRNLGIKSATTDKVFLTDNDIHFDPNAMLEMLKVMNGDPNVVCCLPRLMYKEMPDIINMCGGRIHYIGAYITTGRDKKLDETQLVDTLSVGGGCALLNREIFMQVGGFDEDFMLAWGDDGELHQRFLLAGYKSMYVHNAFGYHEAKPFTKAREYRALGQTYNRWLLLLTHYDKRTLVLMLPALLLYELIQLTFFTINGIPQLYFQANWKVIKAMPMIKRNRTRKQALKKAMDKDIVFAGPILVTTSKVGFGKVVVTAINAVSLILKGYWKLIRPLLRSK